MKEKIKHYVGTRIVEGDCIVTVTTDKVARLDPRLDLVNHSPTGFNWGYGGSGPAQLALALLADCTDDDFALEHYQQFKEDYISRITKNEWSITSTDILKMASRW